MKEELSRTAMLLGEDGLRRLRESRVAVFGLGGVGGHAAEALARSGVGHLELVDRDTVSLSNINRQLFALHSTVGMLKTEAAAARIRDIDPEIEVRTYPLFFGPDTASLFDFSRYDYVVDAVDTVSAKLELVTRCHEAGTPVISSMGAGNKLDPTAFRVADLYETQFDPLARVMRRELRRRGILSLRVVWSPEPPRTSSPEEGGTRSEPGRRAVPGSCAFVPSAAGLILAGAVVRAIAGIDGK